MCKSYFYLILIFLGLQTVSPAAAQVVSDVSTIALDAQESQPQDSQPQDSTLDADPSVEVLPQPITENSAPKPAETIETLTQSTPVSQLQDIDARHWAAQALRQLSQRYNCLPSYFTEEAVLTRYEFADILYTCMEVVNQALLDSTAENASQEDLAVVQRLQEEFQGELTELGERVDNLEAQVDTLAEQQFVKRTNLFAIAEFIAADSFGDSLRSQPGRTPSANPANANTTFTTGNIILDIDAKVRGKDFVRTELTVTNMPSYGRGDTGTDMTRIDALAAVDGRVLEFGLNYLFYQRRFAQKGVLRVGPVGLVPNHIFPDFSPTQANSRFGRRNPIYRPGVGAGFLATYQFNDWLGVGTGYTVGGDDAANPSEGFFNAQNRFIAQAAFTPSPKLGLGLTYSRLYQDSGVSVTGLTGSRNAQAPFGEANATSADLFGLQGNYRISKRFGIGGWVGYTRAVAEEDFVIPGLGSGQKGESASIWNWAIGMTIADVGRKGNSLGFLFGMPPKAVSNDFHPFEDEQQTSYHGEVYYVYRINPQLSITPGVFAVFNPEQNADNGTLVVALIRTSMRF